jgi:hypothetical protein
MSERIWDKFLTERDKAVFAAGASVAPRPARLDALRIIGSGGRERRFRSRPDQPSSTARGRTTRPPATTSLASASNRAGRVRASSLRCGFDTLSRSEQITLKVCRSDTFMVQVRASARASYKLQRAACNAALAAGEV